MSRIAPVDRKGVGPFARFAYRYAARRFGQVPEPFTVAAHSRPVLWATAVHESLVERTWTSLDVRLRELAVLRAALSVDCPWCVDFGAMLMDGHGIEPRKVEDLPRWRDSDAYDEVERLVLEYAEAMSTTPLQVTDELVDRLREHLSERQLVELTALVALENARARQNLALGIEPQRYASSCAVPRGLAEPKTSGGG